MEASCSKQHSSGHREQGQLSDLPLMKTVLAVSRPAYSILPATPDVSAKNIVVKSRGHRERAGCQRTEPSAGEASMVFANVCLLTVHDVAPRVAIELVVAGGVDWLVQATARGELSIRVCRIPAGRRHHR